MFEVYPIEEDALKFKSGEEFKNVTLNNRRLKTLNSKRVPELEDEEPGFRTVNFYNIFGNLLKGVQFTSTPPSSIKETVSEENFYSRGLDIYNFVNSSPQVNNVFSDYTISDDIEIENDNAKALYEQILSVLGEETTDQEVIDSDQFKNLVNILSVRDIGSKSGKNQIYDYWENYAGRFDQFSTSSIGFSVPNMEEFEQGGGELAEVRPLLRGLKLPALTIKHIYAEWSQEDSIQGIVNDILKELGMDKTQEERMQAEMSFDEEGNVSGTPNASLAETVSENVDDIKTVVRKTDPLTYLYLQREGKLYLDEKNKLEVKTKVLTDIYNNVRSFNNPVYIDYLDEMIDESVENYAAELVEKAEGFFLPVLDDTNMKAIPIKKGYRIPYHEMVVRVSSETIMNERGEEVMNPNRLLGNNYEIAFERKEQQVSTYEDAVNFINGSIGDLLEALNKISVQGKFKRFLNNIPVVSRRATGGGTSGDKGAVYPSFVGETPSMVVAEGSVYKSLMDKIYDLYVSEIKPQYFFGKDLPNYTKSPAYKTFTTAYRNIKNEKSTKVMSQISQYPSTAVDTEDLQAIRNFWLQVRRGSTGNLGELIRTGETVIEAYSILVRGISDSRSQITETTEKITNSIGRIIYDIAKLRNAEQLEATQYEGRQIKYYSDKTIDTDLLDILPLLQDEEFQSTLSKKDKSVVRRIAENLEGDWFYEIVGESEDEEKAFLKAIDYMRNSNGLFVHRAYFDINNVEEVSYVSDLIRKEDRVDVYAMDMEKVLKMKSESFEDLSAKMGVSQEVIYKIRGLFR